MKTSDFVAGRCYAIDYRNDVEMVNKRAFKLGDIPLDSVRLSIIQADSALGMLSAEQQAAQLVTWHNPLASAKVLVHRVSRLQAAGNNTYENVMRKDNPDFEKSGRVSWYHATENECVVEHNRTTDRYLRGIPRGKVSESYTVGGQPATSEEVAIIQAFKKNRSSSGDFCVIKLDNMENVKDDLLESELTGED